jgi:uncharacterized protein YndB with AHSA1/START domain
MKTVIESKEIAERSYSVTRLINAPVKLVFEVWTKPEHIKHWWGPRGFTNTISKMDVKPNGEWIFVMHGPDGTNYDNKNIFIEIIKNEKIVIRHAGPPDFKLIATFKEQGGKTLLNITSLFESAEQLKYVVENYKADIGLRQNVDKLEEYLGKTSADSQLTITREFNAPREMVYKAWTDPKQFAQWWGPKGDGINIRTFELKPEGTCLYSMKMPDGNEMWGKFVYKELVTPERIVFINSFTDKDGNVVPAPFFKVWPLQIMNVLTLTEHEGKTILILRGGPIGATAEEYAAFDEMKSGMQGGFKGTFDQLEEFLQKKN